MHTHTHTHTHNTHTHTCTHTHTHTHTCTHIHTRTHSHLHLHMHARMHTHTQSVIDCNAFPLLINVMNSEAAYTTRKEAAWAILNAMSGGTKQQLRCGTSSIPYSGKNWRGFLFGNIAILGQQQPILRPVTITRT